MKIKITIRNPLRFVNLVILLILSKFLICSTSIAQIKLSDFENVTHYDISNGLPSSSVEQIKEDALGFLWIATADGVSRFDGTNFMNFTHYNHNNAQHKINTVHTLFMDKINKKLWIGSDEGLFYTSIDTLNFKKNEKEGSLFLEYNNKVLSLFEGDNNRLWVAGSSVLYSINLSNLNQPSIVYNNKIPMLSEPFTEITNIAQEFENKEIFWFSTTKGLLRFNKNTEKCMAFRYNKKPELNENSIRKIHVSQNEILLGTWSAGLIVFDKNKETFNKPLDSQFPNSHKTINDLYFDKHNLWISTRDGLVQYNCATQKVIEVQPHDIKKGIIKGVSFVDSRGIIWYGNSLGLFKYSSKKRDFHFLQLENRSKVEVPMTPRKIIEIDGMYYVAGYASSGIYKINPENYTVKVIKTPLFSLHNFGYVIMDMVKMPDNKLLIASNKQILILDTKTEQSTLSSLQIEHPNPSIQTIEKDRNDKYWIGTRKAGLFKIDYETNTITSFKKALNEFKNDNFVWINRLYMASNNKLWISKGSFTVLDLDREVIHNLNLNKNIPYYQDVFGIQEDSKGRVWMAGGRWGLGYINFKTFRKGITHKIDGYFYGVYARNDSILWTIGDKQLGELNLNSLEHTWVSLDMTNKNIKPKGPIIKNGKGEYIIGCENGVLIHNISLEKETSSLSAPYISAIDANEKPFFTGRNLNTRVFNFNSNTTLITVKLSALNFNSTEGVTYSYKIKDNWIKTTPEDEINFTNLPPGDYNFHLRANNLHKGQLESFASYQFNILPPLWKTWWAYLIYLGLLAGLAWWFYRFQLSRKLAVAEGQRLNEINQLKNSLYTNITHEFRTPLTVILGMTDSLKTNGNVKSKPLEMIERNSNKLLHLVNEMLDLAKLENGRMELHQVTADIIPFVKYLCESFQSFAEESNIKLTVNSEIEELTMDFDTTKLSTIMSNLLTNAIKFTPEGGEITIHLNQGSEKNAGFFFVKFRDTGIGISEKSLPHIFNRFYQVESTSSQYIEGTGIGLALTKELVELMGGTIAAKSSLHQGSEFIVKLPINKTAHQITEFPIPLKPYLSTVYKEMPLNLPISDLDGDLPLALIIEDSTDVAYYLKTSLKGNYRTIFAQNGKIGLDMAYKNIPDVVICDVMMPEKDGFEVCKALKSDERTDHIPIILLTAKANDNDRLSGLSHGADAYLTKPFNVEELHIRLNKLIQLRKKMTSKLAADGFTSLLKSEVENPEAKFLQKAIKIIHTELDNGLFDSKSLARSLHLSDSQLYRKLKAISGKSSAVFIRSVRLQKAKELIQTTNKNIAEIAYDVGFNDPSWFSRAFKEEFGFAPNTLHK